MKPIDQTRYGVPHGNCFNACLASLLEIPLETIPDLHAGIGGEDFHEHLSEYLRQHRLYPVCFKLEPGTERRGWVPTGLHILSGKSPRGEFLHSVVAQGRRIVHDPHPSRAGILTREDVILMVPLDPADCSSKTT